MPDSTHIIISLNSVSKTNKRKKIMQLINEGKLRNKVGFVLLLGSFFNIFVFPLISKYKNHIALIGT